MTGWFDESEVIKPLEAFSTLPDWLVAAMDAGRVASSLERHVPELRQGGVKLLECEPERLRAKSDQWLARYRLVVQDGHSDPREIIAVGNLWPPSADDLPPAPDMDTPGFGLEGWHCRLSDPRLDLRVEDSDQALPALQGIVDPDAVALLVRDALRGSGYGEVVIDSCDPRVVRYKPGSRCTVVAGLTYSASGGARTPPNPVVIKTHQGDKGQTAWAAMTALWNSPVAHNGLVSLAEPLAYLPAERILVQGPIAEEQTLKELARHSIASGSPVALGRLREELSKTAGALAALHQSGAHYGTTRTLDGELLEVREVIDRLSLSVPELAKASEPLLSRLTALADELPAEEAVSAHHDFRPAQVLLHQGSIGFIDFDGACMAEPALDLGRFRAKLRDIGISVHAASSQPLDGPTLDAHLSLLDGLCDHFLDAYRASAPVSRDRVLLWETSDVVTTMLHAWTKVRVARVNPRLIVLQHHLRSAGR